MTDKRERTELVPFRHRKSAPHLSVDGLPRYRINANGCWIWTGSVWGNYGSVNWCGKNRRVHRATYEFLRGMVPEGMELDHLCRNRLCINPDHLQPVTHAINQQRSPKTAKLSAAEVDEIKARFGRGETRASLARRYAVSWSVIGSICAGRSWQ